MGRALEYENKGEEYENELAMVKYYRGYISAIKDRNQPLALPTGINSGTLSGQVGQYNSLVMQRTNIISASTESNPLINDIDRQLGVLQHGMLVTIDNHVATINTQIKMLHINDEKNNKLAAEYKKLAEKEENVIFGGRLAEYKYYDMDDVIKSAFEAFEKEQIEGAILDALGGCADKFDLFLKHVIRYKKHYKLLKEEE